MRFICKFFFLMSIILSYNTIDKDKDDVYNQNSSNKLNKNILGTNKLDSQIIKKHSDDDIYIVGSGDVFLFNMITTNGVITLDITVSPSGNI